MLINEGIIYILDIHVRFQHFISIYVGGSRLYSFSIFKNILCVCRGLKALWNYMKRQGVNTTQVWENIKDLVVKTIVWWVAQRLGLLLLKSVGREHKNIIFFQLEFFIA